MHAVGKKGQSYAREVPALAVVAACGALGLGGCYKEYLVDPTAPGEARTARAAHREMEPLKDCLEDAKSDPAWQDCIAKADRRLASQPALIEMRKQIRPWYQRPPDTAEERRARLEALKNWAEDRRSLPALRFDNGVAGKRVHLSVGSIAKAPVGELKIQGSDSMLRIRVLTGGAYPLMGGVLVGVSPVFLGLGASQFPPQPTYYTSTNPAMGGLFLGLGVAQMLIGAGLLIASPHVRMAETEPEAALRRPSED